MHEEPIAAELAPEDPRLSTTATRVVQLYRFGAVATCDTRPVASIAATEPTPSTTATPRPIPAPEAGR